MGVWWQCVWAVAQLCFSVDAQVNLLHPFDPNTVHGPLSSFSHSCKMLWRLMELWLSVSVIVIFRWCPREPTPWGHGSRLAQFPLEVWCICELFFARQALKWSCFTIFSAIRPCQFCCCPCVAPTINHKFGSCNHIPGQWTTDGDPSTSVQPHEQPSARPVSDVQSTGSCSCQQSLASGIF